MRRRLSLTGFHSLSRLAAMAALFALLFHAFLPLTQQAARQVQADNGIEQVVLCSALGLRVLALQDGQPVDTDPAKADKTSKLCPVCFGTAGLAHAILPGAVTLVLPQLALTVLYGSAGRSTLAQAQAGSPQARAPPLSLS